MKHACAPFAPWGEPPPPLLICRHATQTCSRATDTPPARVVAAWKSGISGVVARSTESLEIPPPPKGFKNEGSEPGIHKIMEIIQKIAILLNSPHRGPPPTTTTTTTTTTRRRSSLRTVESE